MTASSESLFPIPPAGPERERLVVVLQQLAERLRELRFGLAVALPSPGRLTDLPNDVAFVARALAGRSNLLQSSAVPWLLRGGVGVRAPGVPVLHDLLVRNLPVDGARLAALLGPLLPALLQAGVLESRGARFRCRLTVSPWLEDSILLSDPLAQRHHDDFVYLGRTTHEMAWMLRDRRRGRRKGGRCLDLGCGSGAFALAASADHDEVVGSDVVQRCLELSRLNAELRGLSNVRFVESDLFAAVPGPWDVIVAVPPCGWSPEGSNRTTFSDGGGEFGMEFPRRVLQGALEHLAPRGEVHACLTSPVISGRLVAMDVVEQVFAARAARVVVRPSFAEYNRFRARWFQEHGITAMVRLFVSARVDETPSLAVRPLDPWLWHASRLRSAIPRIASRLLGA